MTSWEWLNTCVFAPIEIMFMIWIIREIRNDRKIRHILGPDPRKETIMTTEETTEELTDRVPNSDRPYIHVTFNGGKRGFVYTGSETDPVDIAGDVWEDFSAFGVAVYANATEYANDAKPLAVADHKGNTFTVGVDAPAPVTEDEFLAYRHPEA
jgi:hypothetical protein